jgi:hypothetical protein
MNCCAILNPFEEEWRPKNVLCFGEGGGDEGGGSAAESHKDV